MIQTTTEILVNAQTRQNAVMYFDCQNLIIDESIVNEIRADGSRDMGRVSFWILCSIADENVKDTFIIINRVPLEIKQSEFMEAFGGMTFLEYLASKHTGLMKLIADRPNLFFGVTAETLKLVTT